MTNILNKTFRFCIFIGVILFLNSCSFNEFENSNRIIDVSNEIELRLLPDLNDNTKLKWYIGTNESAYCEDAFIETQLITEEARQNLLIKGIITPSFCTDLDSRLISIESFPSFENRIIDIDFADDISSSLAISKSGNTYTISHDEVEYFSLDQNELIIEENPLIWFGLNNDLEINSFEIKEDFYDFIENYNVSNLPDGDYGYVYRNEKTEYAINPDNYVKYTNASAYILNSDINYDALRLTLYEFSNHLKETFPNLDFFIATNKGDTF